MVLVIEDNMQNKLLTDVFNPSDKPCDQTTYKRYLQSTITNGELGSFRETIKELDNKDICLYLADIAIDVGQFSVWTNSVTTEVLNRLENQS